MVKIDSVAKQQEAVSPKQTKTQKADDGDFRGMLTGALKTTTDKAATSSQPPKIAEETRSQETQAPRKTEPNTEVDAPKEQSEQPDEEIDDLTDEQNAAVAATIQIPLDMQARPTFVDAPIDLSFLKVQTVSNVEIPKEPIQTLPQQPEQAATSFDAAMGAATNQQSVQQPAIDQTQAVNTQAQSPTVNNEATQQPQQSAVTIEQPQQTQPPQTQEAVMQPVTPQAPVQTQVTPHVEQTQAPQQQTPNITKEIADTIVSTSVTSEAPQVQAPIIQQNIPNIQRDVQVNAEQSRFDEMLAKATSQLNQGKAVEVPTTQQPVETQTAQPQQPIIPQQAADTSKDAAVPQIEVPEATTQAKQTVQAQTPAADKTPTMEQRPLKEIPKTDEISIGMMQQKEPIFTTDTVRSENVQSAQPVQVPEQAEQIKAQMLKNLESDKMEFQMQLNPKELGKVDVKMVLESGKLSVEIIAANPKSAELLTKQAESLVASLKTGNLDISSVNVVTASENASANMNSQYNLNNFQNQAGQGQQSGQSTHGNKPNQQGGTNDTAESSKQEASSSPQRILNYSV